MTTDKQTGSSVSQAGTGGTTNAHHQACALLRARIAQTNAAIDNLLSRFRPPPVPAGEEAHAPVDFFFSQLALQFADPKTWSLIQRLRLERVKHELAATKFKESLRTKIRLGLKTVAAALKDNPEALKLFNQIRTLLDPQPHSNHATP